MAQQIKNFWLKLGTMFLTLYFAPLSHFFAFLFGRSDAMAGSYGCGVSYVPLSCKGYDDDGNEIPDGTIFTRDTFIRCACQDPTKVFSAHCDFYLDTSPDGTGRDEYKWVYDSEDCSPLNACSPNGATKDCSTAAQYGTQTCVNGEWGACQGGACKPGYIKIGGDCNMICDIENGEGYEINLQNTESSSSATL